MARLYSEEYRAAVRRSEAEWRSAQATRERAAFAVQSAKAARERLSREELAAGARLEPARHRAQRRRCGVCRDRMALGGGDQ